MREPKVFTIYIDGSSIESMIERLVWIKERARYPLEISYQNLYGDNVVQLREVKVPFDKEEKRRSLMRKKRWK